MCTHVSMSNGFSSVTAQLLHVGEHDAWWQTQRIELMKGSGIHLGFFYNLQTVAVVQLDADRSQNRSQRSSRPSLFANHFPDVGRIHPQSQDGASFIRCCAD